jgi:hypothetical protein
MTRALLQWSNIRPTLLRAVGRSGVEYRLEKSPLGNRWMLTCFASLDDPGTHIMCGHQVDMKAIAEEREADELGEPRRPQRIAWSKIRAGHYWGISDIGVAYRILNVGRQNGEIVWTLERFENEDAELGTPLDDGSLQACKRRAVEDATEAAKDRRSGMVAA